MKNFFIKFTRNRLAVFGGLIILTIVILSIAVPLLKLLPPNEVNTARRFVLPLDEINYLGADHLGRDMLSRLLWGTRLSLAVGFIAAIIAALIGTIIGITAGYFSKGIDNFLMRSIDILMAFPYVLLALAIVAILGPSLLNALIAVAIVNIPFFARNVRGATLSLLNADFVQAARLSGRSDIGILVHEIIPNIISIVIVTFSSTLGWMILETAGLSFLGLGSQPPQADLGSMLGEGRAALITHPHTSIIPGVMILLIVMGINLFGDGIRDALDPRLSQGLLVRSSPKTTDGRKKILDKRSSSLLEVNSLTTEFTIFNKQYAAVSKLDLDIQKGECLALVGESGSGKSVSALSLLGLVPSPPGKITNGSVWFGDKELVGLELKDLQKIRGKKIAFIFQDPTSSLHPLMTIGTQVGEAILLHQQCSKKVLYERCLSLLKEVKISLPERVLQCYPHQLSGGMRQRVGIAMALANSPDLLIADEPTTALDVTVQAQVIKILISLKKSRGLSLLFISHDLNVVSQLSDKIGVMYSGEIVESGAASVILRDPKHPYTKALLACSPSFKNNNKLPSAIPGQPPQLIDERNGCNFYQRCPIHSKKCLKSSIKNTEIGDRMIRCIHLEKTNA